jgi:hypothetical protein
LLAVASFAAPVSAVGFVCYACVRCNHDHCGQGLADSSLLGCKRVLLLPQPCWSCDCSVDDQSFLVPFPQRASQSVSPCTVVDSAAGWWLSFPWLQPVADRWLLRGARCGAGGDDDWGWIAGWLWVWLASCWLALGATITSLASIRLCAPDTLCHTGSKSTQCAIAAAALLHGLVF